MDNTIRQGRGNTIGNWGERNKQAIAESHLGPAIEKGEKQCNPGREASFKDTDQTAKSNHPGEVGCRCLEYTGSTPAECHQRHPYLLLTSVARKHGPKGTGSNAQEEAPVSREG